MENRNKTAETLEHNNIRFLTVLWCDNANVIRSKAIYIPTLLKDLTKNKDKSGSNNAFLSRIERRLTISIVQQAMPVVYDAPVPEAGLDPVREIRLIPDWSTLVLPEYMPGHALAIGNLASDSGPWELCPREMLRRAVKNLLGLGFEIWVGVEIEFFLLNPLDYISNTEQFPEPVDHDLYAQNSTFERARELIDEITDELLSQGIEIANYNVEAGPGQHEFSLQHADPMTTADRIIYARETIKAVANEHGLIASFVPKLYEDSSGSGCHFNISLWSNGKNVTGDKKGSRKLSEYGNHFIAGILDHLPALMSMTTPTANSFRRILPRAWSGAFRVWGIDNKEAAIRVPHNPFGGGPERFEFKTADLSANPYIALAGVIAAGADGLARDSELPDPVQIDPARYTREEMKKLGIEHLPTSVSAAVRKLDKDQVLIDSFGEEYWRVYRAVKLFEERKLKNLSLEEERKILLTRY
jgi:glutamine synthetase